MAATHFATPQEAEQEFYRAFEQRNLQAMGEVWSQAEYIECIHPMGPRLHGREAVLASWREIFADAAAMHFEVIPHNHIQTAQIAVHTVAEKIHTPQNQSVTMLATNIFELTQGGWHMILHHASPIRAAEETSPRQNADTTLH